MSTAVAIVSSRLRRFIGLQETWVAGLRAVVRLIADGSTSVITMDGLPLTRFIRRAALRYELPCLPFPGGSPATTSEILPAPDHALVAAADRIYVLHLRAGGNYERLLRERLDQGKGGVILVDLPELQPKKVRDELQGLGAELWRPPPELSMPFDAGSRQSHHQCDFDPCLDDPQRVIVIHSFPADSDGEFLTHTTRSCPGPWPEETWDEYVDGLLESRMESDHSALGTLRRIVKQKKLIASGRTIRGGTPVVSFTSRPLSQLPGLRQFRPHRIHWDFEPFGICIRKDWLRARGAQPVRYANQAEWRELTIAEQPFFQRATGKSGIDWTVEQEWRVPGDLTLAEATDRDVLLFVPEFAAAKSLADMTTWPITLWPQPDQQHPG